MLESFNVCWQGDQNLFSENILEHIVHCLTKLFQHICNIRQGSQILSIEIKALQRKEWHFQQPLSLRDFYNRFLKCLKHFRQIWPKMAIFCENPQKYHFRMKTVFFPSQNLGWWWNPWGRDHQVWNSLIYRRENQKRQKTRTFTLSAIFPFFFFSHSSPSHGTTVTQDHFNKIRKSSQNAKLTYRSPSKKHTKVHRHHWHKCSPREKASDDGAICQWGQALRHNRVQWVSSGVQHKK